MRTTILSALKHSICDYREQKETEWRLEDRLLLPNLGQAFIYISTSELHASEMQECQK